MSRGQSLQSIPSISLNNGADTSLISVILSIALPIKSIFFVYKGCSFHAGRMTYTVAKKQVKYLDQIAQ